jgi:hypothetical protein
MEFIGKVSSRSIIRTSVLERKLTRYLRARLVVEVMLGSPKTNLDNQGQVLQASIHQKSQIIEGQVNDHKVVIAAEVHNSQDLKVVTVVEVPHSLLQLKLITQISRLLI